MYRLITNGGEQEFLWLIEALDRLILRKEGTIEIDGLKIAFYNEEGLSLIMPLCKRLVLREIGRLGRFVWMTSDVEILKTFAKGLLLEATIFRGLN